MNQLHPVFQAAIAPWMPPSREDFYRRVDAAMADDKANDKRFYAACQQALAEQVKQGDAL